MSIIQEHLPMNDIPAHQQSAHFFKIRQHFKQGIQNKVKSSMRILTEPD
jgi:hypothetical protein